MEILLGIIVILLVISNVSDDSDAAPKPETGDQSAD